MDGITPTDDNAAHLVDLNEASIKNAIVRAKKRGHITYDELNDALPEMTSSQLGYVMNALWQIGIDFIEDDKAAESEALPPHAGKHDTETPDPDEGNDGCAPEAAPTSGAAATSRTARPPAKRIPKVRSKPMIEVTINGASVKIECGADPATIATVLDALKRSH